MNSVNNHKSFIVNIASCKIKVLYTFDNKIIFLLKPFTVDAEGQYNYTLFFNKTHKKIPTYSNKTRVYKLAPDLNVYVFQYFMRKLLQEYLTVKKIGFFIHCSGLLVKNKVWLFMGPSGKGKSTICHFLSTESKVIADDSAIIIKRRSSFILNQTPFIEKFVFDKHSAFYKIEKIFFIYHGRKCEEFKLSQKEASNLFLKQCYSDKKNLICQWTIINQFLYSFENFYKLYFPNKKESVVKWFEKRI